MRLRFLLEKEFKQLLRDSFLPRMILFMPLMMICVMPFASNNEVRDLQVAIVDHSHTTLSRRLVDKVSASKYFELVSTPDTYDEALQVVDEGKADIILELPREFDKEITTGAGSEVYLAANAVNGTRGTLGSNYLSGILQSYAEELRSELGASSAVGQLSLVPTFSIEPQYRFNPTLDNKKFMVPALLVMLLTMITGFLPALNIVGERESGSIEQMNVSPVRTWEFILAKLNPYWCVGIVVLAIAMTLGAIIYGLIPTGSHVALVVLAVLYILTMSGIGLVVSNKAGSMQQAMFIMYFFVMIFLLISGLFTPITSMPQWTQWLTYIDPLRYFIEAIRGIYLRGSGFVDILPQLGALTGFMVFFLGWAVLSYRKQS